MKLINLKGKEDWLIESVKNSELRSYEMMLENPSSKIVLLNQIFAYQLPPDYYASTPDKMAKLSKEDIQRVAQKYLNEDHLTVSIDIGTPKKDKLQKPNIKPIDQPKGQTSVYAEYLKAIPVQELPEVYNNMDDVIIVEMYDKVRLHYTVNPE